MEGEKEWCSRWWNSLDKGSALTQVGYCSREALNCETSLCTFVGIGIVTKYRLREKLSSLCYGQQGRNQLWRRSTSNRTQLYLRPAVWSGVSHFTSLRLNCHTSSKNHSLHHSVEIRIEWDTVYKDWIWDFSTPFDSNSSVSRLLFILCSPGLRLCLSIFHTLTHSIVQQEGFTVKSTGEVRDVWF